MWDIEGYWGECLRRGMLVISFFFVVKLNKALEILRLVVFGVNVNLRIDKV